QAFVYASKQLFAEALFWQGQRDEARRLWREAEELKQRFNDAFWTDDEGTYCMALDGKQRQVRSVGSDAGHCLASGIAATERVPRVLRRLFADDLFSGWGIRTLSAEHPAFNPFSYHRGTVWPVE